MLGDYPVIAMIATTQPERAKAFYSECWGSSWLKTDGGRLFHDRRQEAPHSEGEAVFAVAVHGVGLDGRGHRGDGGKLADKGIKFERYRRNAPG